MGLLAHTLFFYNIFYKNIEAEICEICEYFKNKAEAEIFEKDRYNFVCWNICKYNTIFFCFF